MTIYRLNGKVYHVPADAVAEFKRFKDDVWHLPTKWNEDANDRRVPANFKSICFTIFLVEYADENWKRYIVTENQADHTL